MPTYAYRCDACAHQFEQFQRFSDDPLRDCPECGGYVKRVIQPVGVVFKGSGWYITDSRKPASSEDGADKPEKKPAEKTATTKAETTETKTKPEAGAKSLAAD